MKSDPSVSRPPACCYLQAVAFTGADAGERGAAPGRCDGDLDVAARGGQEKEGSRQVREKVFPGLKTAVSE